MPDSLKAFQVCYEIPTGKAWALRFYENIKQARENCKQVLETEQGYKIISIVETTDPRKG